jgi:hypothetical protein
MTGPKKTSAKQLAANRANARRSTGPRTPAGKARSRWNALRHGVLAKAVIPEALEPYESRPEFAALPATLQDEFAPASAIEEILVERIAVRYWRLARLLRAESGTIARRQREEHSQVGPFEDQNFSYCQLPATPLSHLRSDFHELEEALKNPKRLRALLARRDERWRTASEEELCVAAQERLGILQARCDRERAKERAITQDQTSIPTLDVALAFARYEAHLQRQLDAALASLERLQRLRAGDRVPPPLQVSVDVAAPLAGDKAGVTD